MRPPERAGLAPRAAVLGGALCIASAVGLAAEPAGSGLTPQALWGMTRLSEARPSQDGKRVIFTARDYDAEKNASVSSLWLLEIGGPGPRRLTRVEAHDGSARWLPGGGVLFLSDRGGSSQIWALDPDGGEPYRVSDLPLDVDALTVSPDGRHVAFSLEVFPDCPDLDCTAKRVAERDKSKVKARIYTELLFRHWDTWEDHRRSHLFVAPLLRPAGGLPNGIGRPVDLMTGVDGDAPPKPFGGAEEYAFSPDGREIAYSAKVVGPEAAWSTDLDIYTVRTDGSSPPRELTVSNRATDAQPVYSPDGRSLAWLAMSRPGFEADRNRIVLRDLAGGRERVLAEGWDRSVESLAWAPDSKTLIVSAQEEGRLKIFALDAGATTERPAPARNPRPLVSEGHNTGVELAGNGRIFFLRDNLTSPAEIFSVALDGKGLAKLTAMNNEKLRPLGLKSAEEFWFAGARGDRVHGWLLKPQGFVPGRRYPVAFLVHGGPQGAWLDQFHYRWNPQIYSAAGYVAVAVNFHGSTGYGQAFTDSISGDWGGAPYEDLMKGLDFVLKQYSFTDAGRMAALGASYGGWMINWIAGHTDRFKCLVNHDGGFDELASYYTTEELWFPEWEFRGLPWENPELYERFSPGRLAGKWKTPMLVIHGGKDYRVPETEGFATFTALRRRGIPAKFLYFPDENHWVLKPADGLFWHKTVLDWLAEWTGGAGG